MVEQSDSRAVNAESALKGGRGSITSSQVRQFYDEITRRLEVTGMAEASYFLNYGYVSLGPSDESSHAIVEGRFNSNSVRLVFEIVGSIDLNDRTIVDIGCGRGGTVALLADTFHSKVIGIDISPEAIAFCRSTHLNPATHFKVGDALSVPIDDGCCDAVVNLESSHSYEDKLTFLGEVQRILRPGGWLLYADLLSALSWNEARGHLKALGFSTLSDRDINANVLASRNEAASNWTKFFGDSSPDMANFLGLPGSYIYEQLRTHALEYRILRCQLSMKSVGKGMTCCTGRGC